VLNAIDFVAMHTYPLADSVHDASKWNWQQTAVAANLRAAAMMDAALGAAQSDFAAVRAHMDSLGLNNMPIVVGETGWKAVASGVENYRAHPVNQKMYFDRLASWLSSSATAKPRAIFYFEAFDEPGSKPTTNGASSMWRANRVMWCSRCTPTAFGSLAAIR